MSGIFIPFKGLLVDILKVCLLTSQQDLEGEIETKRALSLEKTLVVSDSVVYKYFCLKFSFFGVQIDWFDYFKSP